MRIACVLIQRLVTIFAARYKKLHIRLFAKDSYLYINLSFIFRSLTVATAKCSLQEVQLVKIIQSICSCSTANYIFFVRALDESRIVEFGSGNRLVYERGTIRPWRLWWSFVRGAKYSLSAGRPQSRGQCKCSLSVVLYKPFQLIC